MKNRVVAVWTIVLTMIYVTFFAGAQQAAQAAVSPLVIEIGEAQEYGMGGGNNFWDLQKNISVDFGRGEFLFLFSDVNPRLTYKGGEGGGFMDAGQLAKPTGQEKLQITPSLLAYNEVQYLEKGHFYILKTLTMGYFALYVDDLQPSGDDYSYMNFTLYRLKGAPAKASSQNQVKQGNINGSGNDGQSLKNNVHKEHSTVMLNEEELSFDVPPVMENGRTLVPLRAIFEALGAKVDWDASNQTITATKGSTQVKLQVGGKTAYKNGATVNLDVPAKMVNNRTMVPLRFVSESLGAKVGWNESKQTVEITTDSNETSTAPDENSQQPKNTNQQVTESKIKKGSFSLTIYKGYKFNQQTVVESGQDADVNFISHWKYAMGTLTTNKIKEFESKPDISSITAQDMSDWKDYVIGPVPGNYYVIKGHNGKCYLLELTSFENQGKAMSYWKVTFNWQEININ